jgi:hypothetical protein
MGACSSDDASEAEESTQENRAPPSVDEFIERIRKPAADKTCRKIRHSVDPCEYPRRGGVIELPFPISEAEFSRPVEIRT